MKWFAGVLFRLGTAVLLFWAITSHRYGFFQLLRVVVTASAILAAAGAYCDSGILYARPRVWLWWFVGCAVLFNPLLPVRLDRASWQIADGAAGLLFLASAATDLLELGRQARKNKRGGPRRADQGFS